MGDYELKVLLRKSHMMVEAILEAIHEYMCEKLINSPETEEEKRVRHVQKRKNKIHKRSNKREQKVQKNGLQPLRSTPNLSKQHMCPVRRKNCIKCGKMGCYAKCCRSSRSRSNIQRRRRRMDT